MALCIKTYVIQQRNIRDQRPLYTSLAVLYAPAWAQNIYEAVHVCLSVCVALLRDSDRHITTYNTKGNIPAEILSLHNAGRHYCKNDIQTSDHISATTTHVKYTFGISLYSEEYTVQYLVAYVNVS
jgi:hypothetical protein